GGNLWLQTTNGGAGRSWVFRWTDRVTKKDRNIGLGPYHTVDIDAAREMALECRKLLLAGKDPMAERASAKLDAGIEAGLAKTVRALVDEWFAAKIALPTRSSHTKKSAMGILGRHVLPTIGDMAVQKVDTNTILDKVGLRRLYTERHATAVQLHSYLKRM